MARDILKTLQSEHNVLRDLFKRMDDTTDRADSEDAARGAAIAIIERGNAAPSPPHSATQESADEQAERLRRLAVELGRSVDA